MDSFSFFKGTAVTGIGLGGSGLTELRATHLSSLGRRAAATAVSVDLTSDQAGSLNYLARPFRFLWAPTAAVKPGAVKAFVKEEVSVEALDRGSSSDGDEEEEEEEVFDVNDQHENWVMKILHIRSIWSKKKHKLDSNGGGGHNEEVPYEEEDQGREMESNYSGYCSECCGADKDGSCEIGEGRVEFDASTFSNFLKKVPLSDASMFAKMSYLGNLAYAIRKIKPANLLKYHGMLFVTSSLERREMKRPGSDDDAKSNSEKTEKKLPENKEMIETDAKAEVEKQRRFGHQISASAAYQIAAAAASYVQSQTRNILPFTSPKVQMRNVNEGESEDDSMSSNITSPKMASFVATTNSVTAVVAAEESLKQAVAKDLNSANSSPCEWFICDEENTATRMFVIQGSETLESWQANLLFEPIKFEGLDRVLVHRGIYEAAKGMYKQMLPAVEAHLKRYGKAAKLRFTGHSLGGSLALLVNLMLLIREDVPRSSLLPVVTFGSPSIMCGGDGLLRKLGLPRSHVQAIIMHRDIVPRAFSCHYPDHVAELLKGVNGNFRNHPCLNHQNILYAPMGEFLILQPDKNFSPEHNFLPTGTGFYRVCGVGLPTREMRTAVMAFLNSPHPLEILSDRAAYGSEGTVYRDHDMNFYLRSLRFLIREELKRLRAKKEESRKIWWPLIVSKSDSDNTVVFSPLPASAGAARKHRLIFAGILQNGKQSLRQISRFVTSQHLHLLMLMIPARFLLLSAVTNITTH